MLEKMSDKEVRIWKKEIDEWWESLDYQVKSLIKILLEEFLRYKQKDKNGE